MIAKAKSITHCFNAIAYAFSKDLAQEVTRGNVSGETPCEIAEEFAVIASLNNRCKNNTIRIELSPTIADGDKLTIDDWAEIANNFIDRMGLSDNQWVAVLHSEKKHKHLHIIANRIGFDGRCYNDSYLSRRAGAVAERIAQERGMTTAMEVKRQKAQSLEPLRKQILAAHLKVERPKMTPAEYHKAMACHGIEVAYNRSTTTGRICGMRYIVGGVKMKASQVDRRLSFNKLFNQPRLTRIAVKQTPRDRIRGRPKIIKNRILDTVRGAVGSPVAMSTLSILRRHNQTLSQGIQTDHKRSREELQEKEQEEYKL